MNCIIETASTSRDVKLLGIAEELVALDLWRLADRLRDIAAEMRLDRTVNGRHPPVRSSAATLIVNSFAGITNAADLDEVYRETYPTLRAMSVEERLAVVEAYTLRAAVLSANDGR